MARVSRPQGGKLITAIVGKPGSGKSYYACSRVLQDAPRYKHVSILMDGVQGIPGVRVLSIDDVAPLDQGGMMRRASDPRGWVTTGEGSALLVLDEVQRIWGTQGGKGQTLSQADREFFQMHRHLGLDVIVIAQGIAQITTQLAVLVDRTIAVKPPAKKMFGGTRLGRVLSLTMREGADDQGPVVQRQMVRVRQEVFAHYRSFEEGVEGEATPLMSGYAATLGSKGLLCVLVMALGLAGAWFAVSSLTGRLAGEGDEAAAPNITEPVLSSPSVTGVDQGAGGVICNERGCSQL